MIEIIKAFILIFVIMDPVVSLTSFLSLTKGRKAIDCKRIAIKAVFVAGLVFLVFALGGNNIFQFLGVDINAFKIAGGIILMLLGIQMTLGLSFPKENEKVSEVAVVIGTPLISGPATITTTMILVIDIGLVTTLIAGIAALAVIFAVLFFAVHLNKYIGRSGLQVLSTMMGIVTIAWGIQFILTGVLGFL